MQSTFELTRFTLDHEKRSIVAVYLRQDGSERENYYDYKSRQSILEIIGAHNPREVYVELQRFEYQAKTLWQRWLNGEDGYTNQGGYMTRILSAYNEADAGNRKLLEQVYPNWFVKRF